MSTPRYLPPEPSLLLSRLQALLDGTATASGGLTGASETAAEGLSAILAEDSGGVYRQLLPASVPGRAVLVRVGQVPGGMRANPANAYHGHLTFPPLQVMCLTDPGSGTNGGDPYRTLDAMQTACYLCLEGARVGYPGRMGSTLALYRSAEPTPPEAYDERLLFSTSEWRCGVHSTAEA